MDIQAIAKLRIPNASLKLLLRVAKTMVRYPPEIDDAAIAGYLGQISEQIGKIEAALALRLRSRGARQVALEVEFDRATDAAWTWLRRQLELLMQVYGHPGLELLSPERRAAIDLPKLRAHASAAAQLHEQLFGEDGTAFLQSPFAVQAESMATLLRIVAEDQLDASLAPLIHPSLLPLLHVCQQQYEEFVDDRLRRESGLDDDFRALRGELRWRLDRYKVAVELLYRPDKPESLELIETALRPLLLLSAQMTRPTTEIEAELDELLVPEDELLTQLEQAGEPPNEQADEQADEQAAE